MHTQTSLEDRRETSPCPLCAQELFQLIITDSQGTRTVYPLCNCYLDRIKRLEEQVNGLASLLHQALALLASPDSNEDLREPEISGECE